MTMSVEYSMDQMLNFTEEKLKKFECANSLWTQNLKMTYKAFQAENPEPSAFLTQIGYYDQFIRDIQLIPNFMETGILLIRTDNLKVNLEKLAKQWKDLYATNLNGRIRLELQNLTNYMLDIQTQISQEIKDLSAVRKIMKALSQFRELESSFDMKVFPLEEIYGKLQDYNINVSRDELEQVEQLRYNFATLQTKSLQVSAELSGKQYQFKDDLETAVKQFDITQKNFCQKWKEESPQEPGIPPQVANKRLRDFKNTFVDIEEKWLTYSTGQDLFGMPITEYPELTQIKQNIKYLDRLYSLYNDVLSTINGYNDQPWMSLNFDDIQKVVNDDFMTKQMKLPKAMREWPAYLELDKVIKDFSLVLPLFTGLKKPFIKQRHWDKLYELTKCEDLKKAIPDADGFCPAKLSDIFKCDPVKYADDIEEITIAAEKEEKIEAQFNKVKDKFKEAVFVFAPFKQRGNLLLCPNATADLVTDLEEQQMILSALKSNRFNKPF